ncbi:hypothetical protein [Actinomadura sp. B10D3]|uniref:hypothetical protein n=1 Tax=Actinomadura sp. B10D3 TaxID=3153557 RepID=UPI00325CDB32
MSEEEAVTGPAMLAATNMLKLPPAVIGSLNEQFTLPRTVKFTTLFAILLGAIVGFLLAFAVLGPGLDALIYGPVLGGGAGWVGVSYSPLQGESLAKWLGLQIIGTRRRKLILDGRPVRLYVGIAPLRRTAAGTVRMLPGGVPVDAVRWDARGVPQQEMPGADRLPPTASRRNRGLTASPRLAGGRDPRRRRH